MFCVADFSVITGTSSSVEISLNKYDGKLLSLLSSTMFFLVLAFAGKHTETIWLLVIELGVIVTPAVVVVIVAEQTLLYKFIGTSMQPTTGLAITI